MEGSRPVGVPQGTVTTLTFHVGLTDDHRVHRGFVGELHRP
jgi:hypothetical protein